MRSGNNNFDNQLYLGKAVSLYNNDDIGNPLKGWAYAINSRECVKFYNANTGSFDVKRDFDDKTIVDFLDALDAANVDIAKQNIAGKGLEVELTLQDQTRKFSIDYNRLKGGLLACGLTNEELNKFSLKELILLECSIASVNNDYLSSAIRSELRAANDQSNAIAQKIGNKKQSELTAELKNERDAAEANLAKANQNKKEATIRYLQYMGDNFVKPLTNPPGILLTNVSGEQLNFEGFHADGLPFQLHIKVNNEIEHREISNFVKMHILTLIDQYAEKLASRDNPAEVLAELKNKIRAASSSMNMEGKFEYDLQTSYVRNNQFYNAVLRTSDNTLEVGKSGPQDLSLPIPDKVKRQYYSEKIYAQEYARLNMLNNCNQKINPEISVNEIQEKIAGIKTSDARTASELSRYLAAASRVLQNPVEENVNDLKQRGQRAEKKSSRIWQALAAVTFAFCAAAGLTSSFAITTGFGVITATKFMHAKTAKKLNGENTPNEKKSLLATASTLFHHNAFKSMSLKRKTDSQAPEKENRGPKKI